MNSLQWCLVGGVAAVVLQILFGLLVVSNMFDGSDFLQKLGIAGVVVSDIAMSIAVGVGVFLALGRIG